MWVDIYDKYAINEKGEVWSYARNRTMKLRVCKQGYRYVSFRANGKRKTFGVHRLVYEIFNTDFDKTRVVDHIDGDRSNNHVENLKLIHRYQTQSRAKCKKRKKGSTSLFKGVTKYIESDIPKPWKARIVHLGKHINLGYFYTEKEAANAYDKAALKLHGEYAALNFPAP